MRTDILTDDSENGFYMYQKIKPFVCNELCIHPINVPGESEGFSLSML